MNLMIDAKSPLPVYQQVIQAIKLEILSGGLHDGDQLPSIRDLAKLLKLNPNTVAKAYYALEAEGFSENRSGSGSRVKVPPGKQDYCARSYSRANSRISLRRPYHWAFPWKISINF